jgi:hypothetical protein
MAQSHGVWEKEDEIEITSAETKSRAVNGCTRYDRMSDQGIRQELTDICSPG